MTLGALLRATAYEVTPRQIDGFQGGVIENLKSVQDGLNQSASKGDLETGLPVSLRLTTDRTSDLRDAVMLAAFGSEAELIEASLDLANRLCRAMDRRSAPGLLVVSVHEQPKNVRQVITWIFPKGQVIRGSGANVDVDEAFILNSRLRKAALLSGANNRAGFLIARVLDYQTTAVDRKAADFWITQFLNAQLQMNNLEATARLASVFRIANDKLDGNREQQEMLHTAIGAVRTNGQLTLSIQSIAMNMLPAGAARDEVLRATSNESEARAIFQLDLPRFDELVRYHIYTLDNGIRVSAPFIQIKDGIKIEETDDGRILSVSGVIEREKIRAHG